MRLWNLRTLTTLSLAVACSLSASAAVKTTQTVSFGGIGANNAGKSTTTISTLIQGNLSRTESTMKFGGKFMKRVTGEQASIAIADLDHKLMRNLNPKKKTYTEVTFDQFLAQRDELTSQLAALRGQAPESPKKDGSSGPQMEFTPKVTVTKAGRAQIGGLNARLLDVLIQLVGKYPDSTDTCEIQVDAKLGFAEPPGAQEVKAFHEKLAAELGFSRAQMLGTGQSIMSAMGPYTEGFEALHDEIRKQLKDNDMIVRQNLTIRAKGNCGGPPSDTGSAASASDSASVDANDDAGAAGAKAQAKRVFKKFKFGRKNKQADNEVEKEDLQKQPAAEDAFMVMLQINMETVSSEKVPDVGSGPFGAPAGWKKVEARDFATANR